MSAARLEIRVISRILPSIIAVTALVVGLAVGVADSRAATSSVSGELSVYTAWKEKDINRMIQGFNKVYPNIKVTGVRSEGGRGALLERLLTEIHTGRVQADIYSTGIPDMSKLLESGALYAYHSPSQKNLYPHFVFKEVEQGFLHPSASLVFMAAYNKNLLKESELPHTWNDLLDPKWKGKIAIDQEPNDIVSGFLLLMGEKEGTAYLRKLSKNVILRRGRTLLVELLSSGEFPITIDVYTHRVAGFVKKGAPIGPVPTPAYFASPNVDAILKDAPHLDNAKLWIDWVESPAGQQVIAKMNRPPVGNTKGAEDVTGPLIKGRKQVVLTPSSLPMAYNDIARLARNIFILGR